MRDLIKAVRFWAPNEWVPQVGQRVRKHAVNAAHMPGCPMTGTVTKVCDRYSMHVLCDGRTDAELYAIALWEPGA